MKYRIIILSALILSFYSCTDNSDDFNRSGSCDRDIVVSNVKLGALETKASASEETLVGNVDCGDFSLKVYETDEISDAGMTKVAATEIKAESLARFKMYGYLGSEIKNKKAASDADKNNLNFIPDVPIVQTTSDTWDFESGPYKWRYGINHYFWAYYPEDLGLTVNTAAKDTTKASFSFTNDGTKDVIVAYTKRYFGKNDDDQTLVLPFHHALAEFCCKTKSSGAGASVSFIGKDGDVQEVDYEEEGSSTRVKIDNVEIRQIYTKGDCSVSGEDGTFTWSNLSKQSGFSKGEKDSEAGEYKPWFVIPQERSNTLVYLEATDKVRTLTIPFVFEGKDAFGTGIWQAGHRYNYYFKYSFKVPEVTAGTTGIDATFSGKGFYFKKVVDNLPGKYIAQIKISWTGVVDANPGNGTYYMMGIKADDGTEDGSFTEPSSYTASVLKAANIGFCVNHKSQECILGTVGSYSTSASRDVLNAVPCSCTIDIPENMDKFDIYALYTGGQNGQCYWHMSNMKVEVTAWR